MPTSLLSSSFNVKFSLAIASGSKFLPQVLCCFKASAIGLLSSFLCESKCSFWGCVLIHLFWNTSRPRQGRRTRKSRAICPLLSEMAGETPPTLQSIYNTRQPKRDESGYGSYSAKEMDVLLTEAYRLQHIYEDLKARRPPEEMMGLAELANLRLFIDHYDPEGRYLRVSLLNQPFDRSDPCLLNTALLLQQGEQFINGTFGQWYRQEGLPREVYQAMARERQLYERRKARGIQAEVRQTGPVQTVGNDCESMIRRLDALNNSVSAIQQALVAKRHTNPEHIARDIGFYFPTPAYATGEVSTQKDGTLLFWKLDPFLDSVAYACSIHGEEAVFGCLHWCFQAMSDGFGTSLGLVLKLVRKHSALSRILFSCINGIQDTRAVKDLSDEAVRKGARVRVRK
ncbi:hypothetical protein HDK77DRAFT_514637 [Phyllosticta capitalensis]